LSCGAREYRSLARLGYPEVLADASDKRLQDLTVARNSAVLRFAGFQ
jgi:hypothetical protein